VKVIKKEMEELKNLIKNQNKPKVPEWVKNNAKKLFKIS